MFANAEQTINEYEHWVFRRLRCVSATLGGDKHKQLWVKTLSLFNFSLILTVTLMRLQFFSIQDTFITFLNDDASQKCYAFIDWRVFSINILLMTTNIIKPLLVINRSFFPFLLFYDAFFWYFKYRVKIIKT